MKISSIIPKFVEFIPKEIQEGTLYISEIYATASHKCACGCGERVVTPLSAADWQLRKNGEMVSLHPSIGNWNYTCRSHYWIRNNRIVWSTQLNSREIERVQLRDRIDKARQIDRTNRQREVVPSASPKSTSSAPVSEDEAAKLSNQIAKWYRDLFRS